MALIDQAYLDAFRQTPAAGATSIVAAAIAAAEGWLVGMIGYSPEQATVTGGYWQGDGTRMWRPGPWPITAVTSLTLDGVALSVLAQGGTDTGQACYIPAHGRWIERRDGGVFTAQAAIKATYTYGYAAASVPDDIKIAVAMLTWILLEERSRIGMSAKSLGPEQISVVARSHKDYPFIISTVRRYGILP